MRLHLGGPPTSALRYRVLIAILLVGAVYLYHGQSSHLGQLVESCEKRLEACEQHASSVVAKLKVIWEHKQKVETNVAQLKAQLSNNEYSSRNLKNNLLPNLQKLFNSCETSVQELQSSLKQCEGANLPTTTVGSLRVNDPNTDQIAQLNQQIAEFQKALLEKDALLANAREESRILKDEVLSCHEKLHSFAGAAGVPKYSLNETASFQRKHKANDPLAFDRGNIQLQAPKRLLSGQELANKLQDAEQHKQDNEKNSQLHPQDREQKDDYVNEVPNKNEHDYKEH